jgi:glycosyltransferase 2 family protein
VNRLDIAQTSSKLAMEEGKDNLGEQAVKAEQNLLALIQATVARLRGLSEATKLRLKLAISLIMLASLFLLGKVDLGKSWQAAKAADMRFILLAVVLSLSITFINAQRWRLLANAVDLQRPFLQMVQYCFVGLFFNLFFPSTVGGDFSRCYYLSKGAGRYKDAFYSVLADRVFGISVLFLFASVGILFGPGGDTLPWQLKLPIFAGGLFTFVILPMLPYLVKRILGKDSWLSRRINDSVANIYWQDKALIFKSLFLSILLQVVAVLGHICIGCALSLNQIPIWYYFVFYPSVAVLGFITPSFNGIGIREWAYIYFLMLMGVDRANAMTFAIILLGLNTLTCLVGGIVYLAGHFTFSKAEAEQLRHEAL